MTSSAKRQREAAQREARLLEEIGAGLDTPPPGPEDLVEAFKDPLADLVDGLLALVDQPSVAAMHEALAADAAELRLVVRVAPTLRIVLYVVFHETPPRQVTLAAFGAEPLEPDPGPSSELLN